MYSPGGSIEVTVWLRFAIACFGWGFDPNLPFLSGVRDHHLAQDGSNSTYYYLFIYYMVYTHVKSFTIVKNRKSGQVTSHCRKARPYRADLSLFLNVPVVTVKSEISQLIQTSKTYDTHLVLLNYYKK